MVYYYHSAIPGAPVLSGTAGALKNVLKTCLVDGFGTTGVTSIVVASNVATVTFSDTHPFARDIPMSIAGATPAGLNGLQKVLSVTSTTATFATSGIADGTATGTITAKVPGAGWTEVFAGTNLTALKPSAVEATGMLLRVDDTGTTAARVRGFDAMTDINTGTNPFPTDAQISGGMYWPKSSSVGATPVDWELYADDRGFHFSAAPFMGANANNRGRAGYWFGDILPTKSGDAWACLLTGESSISPAYGQTSSRQANPSAGSPTGFLARSHTQIGGSQFAARFSALISVPTGGVDATHSGALSSIGGSYPNAPNNGLLTSPVFVLEGVTSSTSMLRGLLPGVYHSPQFIAPNTFASGDVVVGSGDMAGRRLVVAAGYGTSTAITSLAGAVFYDATGPWR